MGLSTWIADLAARGNAMDKYSDVLNKSSSESVTVSKVNKHIFGVYASKCSCAYSLLYTYLLAILS